MDYYRVGNDPSLPTYKAAAEFLEKKNGSGIRLLGWTFVRMLLIGPPMLLVGIPFRKALLASLLSSGLISGITVLRVKNEAEKK